MLTLPSCPGLVELELKLVVGGGHHFRIPHRVKFPLCRGIGRAARRLLRPGIRLGGDQGIHQSSAAIGAVLGDKHLGITGVRLASPADGSRHLTGRVADVAFRGRGYEYAIEAGLGRLTGVFARHRATRGDQVGMLLEPEGCHLFPAGPAASDEDASGAAGSGSAVGFPDPALTA